MLWKILSGVGGFAIVIVFIWNTAIRVDAMERKIEELDVHMLSNQRDVALTYIWNAESECGEDAKNCSKSRQEDVRRWKEDAERLRGLLGY